MFAAQTSFLKTGCNTSSVQHSSSLARKVRQLAENLKREGRTAAPSTSQVTQQQEHTSCSPSTREEPSVPRTAPRRSSPPCSWLEPPKATPLCVGSSETAAALLAGVLISAAADRATLRDKGSKANSRRTRLRSLIELRQGVRRRTAAAPRQGMDATSPAGGHKAFLGTSPMNCRHPRDNPEKLPPQ